MTDSPMRTDIEELRVQVMGLRILNGTNARRANEAEDYALRLRSELAHLTEQVRSAEAVIKAATETAKQHRRGVFWKLMREDVNRSVPIVVIDVMKKRHAEGCDLCSSVAALDGLSVSQEPTGYARYPKGDLLPAPAEPDGGPK